MGKTSRKTSRKKLMFTKSKCGKKSKIPCYCAKKKNNKLKRSICLKKTCSNRNIDVMVGDYYRILRLRQSMFAHTYIEIENNRNKCIYSMSFASGPRGTQLRQETANSTIGKFKSMTATSINAPKSLKQKYLPYRGKQPTISIMIHDRSSIQETAKYKELYSNIGNDQIHTRKQKRGLYDWGYLTKDQVNLIYFIKKHGEYVKQYKYKKDKTTYLALNTGLIYDAWSKWPREFTTLAYTSLFGSVSSAINPLLLVATPIVGYGLYEYFSSVEDKIDSYNCILGAFAFHKKPKRLLDDIKKHMLLNKSHKKSKKNSKEKSKKKSKKKNK
jgi:hypothetical protein